MYGDCIDLNEDLPNVWVCPWSETQHGFGNEKTPTIPFKRASALPINTVLKKHEQSSIFLQTVRYNGSLRGVASDP